MIKAGIFDVGGVLIHWDGRYINEDVLRTLDISKDIFSQTWSTVMPLFDTGKITEEEFWKRFLAETNTQKKLPKESLFLREFKKRFSPSEEVFLLVRRLKQQGLRLAVLSNTVEPHTRFLREKGIYDMFDVVILSNEVGLSKPAPQIFLLTLQKLHLRSDETFFVDDLKEHEEAASKLGIHGIWYQNYPQLVNDLKQLGLQIN